MATTATTMCALLGLSGGALGSNLQSVHNPLRMLCSAFYIPNCHPWSCMLLNLRFHADSIPSALTTLFKDLPITKPARKHFTEVLKKRELARMGSKRTAHLRHTSMG